MSLVVASTLDAKKIQQFQLLCRMWLLTFPGESIRANSVTAFCPTQNDSEEVAEEKQSCAQSGSQECAVGLQVTPSSSHRIK